MTTWRGCELLEQGFVRCSSALPQPSKARTLILEDFYYATTWVQWRQVWKTKTSDPCLGGLDGIRA